MASLAAPTTQAADIEWDGTTGLFSNGVNWVGDVAPGSGDNANISNGGTAQVTSGDLIEVVGLNVNDGFVTQDGDGSVTGTGAFTAGVTGSGSLTMSNTSTYTNTTGGNFTLGSATGTTGNLSMSGTAQIVWRDTFAGGTGGGTANVTISDSSGITVTDGEFWVGNGAGSTSSFTASNSAQINTSNWTVIGRDGGSTGTLTLKDNSTLTKTGGGNLIVGDLNGSTGTLVATDGAAISDNGELWVGNGLNSTGTMMMSGSSTFSNNNWIAVGRGGGNGTLELSGSAHFTKNGGGQFVIGVDPGDSQGKVTVRESATLEVLGGNLVVGEALGAGTHLGELNLKDNATLTVNGELQVGNGGASVTGTLNMSGGTLTANNWVAVGRQDGNGTLNLSGGTFTHTGTGSVNGTGGFSGNNFTTGGLGAANGTINHTGGILNNSLSVLVVGETGTVNWNASGGTANLGDVYVGFTPGSNGTLSVSGTASYIAQNVFLSSNGATGGGAGTLNLNGGTLTASAIQEGAGNTGTVHFNGGTLRAGAASADFVTGFESGDVTIDAGGLTFDTNTFNVTITMTLSGTGGIAKIGAGTLTLTGADAYAGSTLVVGGTLSITSGFLSDGANVGLTTGSIFDLNFAGTDTVNALSVDGVFQATGTWGAIGSGAQHESTLFSGTGLLNVTSAVPEPGTVALLAMGIAFLGFKARHQRRTQG